MIKTYFKWAVMLFTALTLSLTFVSCDEDEKPIDPENPENPENPDDPEKPGDFSFILNEKTVEMSAEGGVGKVTYTLKNPIEGEKIQISYEADWVTEMNTDTPDEIGFTVAANHSYEPRSVDVNVKYSSKESVFSIKQAGEEIPDVEQFVIEINNLQEIQFDVKVTPFDDNITYTANILDKKLYDKYETDADLIVDDLEWYEYLASQNGMSLEEVLAKILHKGVWEDHWEDCLSDSEYYFFAYGLTEQGDVSTDVTVKHFKTKAPEMIDMTFDISVSDIKNGSFRLDVVPSRNDVYYYFDFANKSDLGTPEQIAEQVQGFMTQVMRAAYMHNETWQQALANVLSMGPDFYQPEGVISNSDCLAYAVAIDEEGQVCSEVQTYEFRTFEQEMSQNIITGDAVDIRNDGFSIQFHTTNNDPYTVICTLDDDRYYGKSDEYILNDLAYGVYSKLNNYTGDALHTEYWLKPDCPYVVYAFGWDNTLTSDRLTTIRVRTAPAPDPLDLQMQFDIQNITAKDVLIKFIGTPKEIGYFYGLSGVEQTGDDVKKMIYETYKYSNYSSYLEFLQDNLARGEYSATIPLFQSLKYKPFAVAVDEEAGALAGDVFFGEPFQAKEAAPFNGSVNVTWDKYYDHDAIHEKFPKTGSDGMLGLGYALLPTQSNVEAPDNMYLSFTAVYEDADQFEDAEIIYSLTTYSSLYEYNEWLVKYDTPFWICAVVSDAWKTNFTKLYKERVVLSADGISEIGDFKPIEYLDKRPYTTGAEVGLEGFDMMNPFINRAFVLGKPVDRNAVERLNGKTFTANSIEENAHPALVRSSEVKEGTIAEELTFKGRTMNSFEKKVLN